MKVACAFLSGGESGARGKWQVAKDEDVTTLRRGAAAFKLNSILMNIDWLPLPWGKLEAQTASAKFLFVRRRRVVGGSLGESLAFSLLEDDLRWLEIICNFNSI